MQDVQTQESDMSDVLLLVEIDLNSHRSIGLFILTIDLQYSAPSEIILEELNNLHDSCPKISENYKNIDVSLCLFFLGSPNAMPIR